MLQASATAGWCGGQRTKHSGSGSHGVGASRLVLQIWLCAGWWQTWLYLGSMAGTAGCSSIRSVGEEAEHEDVMISWFTGTMKLDHREKKASQGEGARVDPTSEPPLPTRHPEQNRSHCVLVGVLMC